MFVAVIMYTIHVSTLCVLTVMCSLCVVATVSVPSVTEHCILPFHLCKVCLCVLLLDCYCVRWSCQVHIGDTLFPSAQLKHKRLSANTNHPPCFVGWHYVKASVSPPHSLLFPGSPTPPSTRSAPNPARAVLLLYYMEWWMHQIIVSNYSQY